MNTLAVPRSPLLDASLFAGRLQELQEIAAFLKGNQSVSIIGPHRIGKTSLMRRLAQCETWPALGIGESNLFVFIECQALRGSQRDEIYAHFCAEIERSLQRQGWPPEPGSPAAGSRPAWGTVEAILRKLNQGGLRVVLMLDDFEQLTQNPHLELGFYNALRSAAGRLRLVFLTTSRRPLFELPFFDPTKKILSSPFFNIFAQQFLGLLSESEARDLIRMALEPAGFPTSKQLVDFLYRLVGGHPPALLIACSQACGRPADFPRIERETKKALEPILQADWQDLSPAEQEALRHHAEAGKQAAGNPALAVILRDLVRRCLLAQAGESYTYPSKAWAEFISGRDCFA